MQEVTTVSLGGVVLSLERDAKELITKYLAKNRTKLKGNEAADEIIEDLEAAIGVHLIEKGYSDKHAANKTAVQTVLEQMGEVDDADEDVPASDAKDWRSFFKEPFRLSKTNRVIFGIAGSLAERIGIDAFWIRILFVILAFVTDGWFVGLYIITGLVVSVIEDEKPVNAKTVSAQFRQASTQASAKMLTGWRKYLRLIDRVLRWIFTAVAVCVAGLSFAASLAALAWVYITMLGRPLFDMPFVGTNRSLLAYALLTSGLLLVTWLSGLMLIGRLYTTAWKKANRRIGILLILLATTVLLLATFVASAFNLRTTIVDWGTRHPDQPFVQVQHWDDGQIQEVCVGVCPTGPKTPIHMIQQTDTDGHTTIITPPNP